MVRQTERLDLRLGAELLRAVEQLARAKDRSVAWVVRDALKRYVEQEKQQAPSE